MCGMTDQPLPPTATLSSTTLSSTTLSSTPLRLDPRRTLLWRDLTTLQIGADPALAVLEHIDNDELRLIDSLTVGITPERLHGLAEHLGVRRERVDGLLGQLEPALEPSSPDAATCDSATLDPGAAHRAAVDPAAVHPVAWRATDSEPLVVVGRGPGAERVAGVLAEGQHPVTLIAPGASLVTRARAAVLVSTHVVDPWEHARWLRRDRPHLPVVFGEVAVTVGPLVIPGASACLRCVECGRSKADPARTVLASQLWGRAAAAETPTSALAAGLAALRMLRSGSAATSVRIDARTGATSTAAWNPDPDCGCHGFTTRAEPEARRESGSVPARRALAPHARPTTTRALAARA